MSPALPAGYVLQEYNLLSVLGMGGFGITYLATDSHLNLKVAIKEFFPANLAVRNHVSGSVAVKSEQSQPDYIWGKSRFIQESQTLARFHHKSIVQVYRYFEANETSYMVMAYEEGKSLEQALADDSIQWNEQTVLDFTLPLLDGLRVIHEAGFLHRDIKPSNIILRSKDGTPVLLDFGSARAAVTTQTMTAVVSPGYCPVEQYFDQGTQGPWTDIYSLAAVLYRIVTGRSPVPAPQRTKKDSMLPAVFAATGAYSKDFLRAIDLALSIDETKRPQTIEAWRLLLSNESSVNPVQDIGITGGTNDEITASDAKALNQTKNLTSSLRSQGNLQEGQNQVPSDSSSNLDAINNSVTLTKPETRQSPQSEVKTSWLKRSGAWVTAHPLVILSGFLGFLAATGVAITISLAPTDRGAMFYRTSDYLALRYNYALYTSNMDNFNFDAAYDFLSPSTQADLPLSQFKAAWQELKQVGKKERYHSTDFTSDTEATIVAITTLDGIETGTNPQRWIKINGDWYRDKLSDMQRKVANDRMHGLIKVNRLANFSIDETKTEWTFLKSGDNQVKAHPVTTFKITNRGETPISTLYISTVYFDKSQNKAVGGAEWSIIDNDEVLPAREVYRNVIRTKGDWVLSLGPFKNSVDGAKAVKKIETQYFFRLDQQAPWERKTFPNEIR